MKPISRFSGSEKAAAILLLMGKEPAAKLAEFFSKDELNLVVDAAHNLPGIDLDMMEQLVHEFQDNYLAHSLSAGSLDLARILNGDASKSKKKSSGKEGSPPNSDLDPKILTMFFENEPAQISSILIDRLDDDLVVSVFNNLEPDLRNQIFQAYLNNNNMEPRMKALFETELLQMIGETDVGEEEGLDVTKVARLINQFPIDTSDQIVSHIESNSPMIAAAIKKSLFKFSGVPVLTHEDRAALFDGVTSDDIVQALSHEDENNHESILEVLSPRNRRMVESELSRGQTSVEDCEKAQKLIAIRALQLAQEDIITLPDPE